MSLENMGRSFYTVLLLASSLATTSHRVCGVHKSHVGAGLPAMRPEQPIHLLPTCDVQQAGDFYRAGFRSIGD
ncbi:hypothetical protein EMIT0232MI5_70236 [Pseudomonas sp. IT-232MI5]